MSIISLDFPFALGQPERRVGFRETPEDFIVDEVLTETFSDSGEHFWLRIRKRGENTEWLAKKLANYFSVRKMDVGYGGKKDRHAVTSQWFSVYLPGRPHDIDWDAFISMSGVDAQLLEQRSHCRKLKRGAHQANDFCIRLLGTDLKAEIEPRLEQIQACGVPNYFGEQRFGRGGANLDKCVRWVKDPRSVRDRNLKGLLISSARSYLFNCVLADRVKKDNWLHILAGESETFASGPLWGRGRSPVTDAALACENEVLEVYSEWREALENVGLLQERRALCLQPTNMEWAFDHKALEIKMRLGTGEFATSLLRELVQWGQVSPEEKR